MRFQNLKYQKRLLKWRKLQKWQKPSPDFLKEKLLQPLRKELLKRQRSQFQADAQREPRDLAALHPKMNAAMTR